MNQPPRLVVLISGAGSNLQALIEQQQAHQTFEIVGVLSNRPQVQGLTRASAANIATQVVDHTQYPTREAFDAEVAKVINTWQPDWIILAGYMRIMTPQLVQQFKGKLINIHPSLLPKYPGLRTHQKALEAGDHEHGSSVHFVTEELDGGPVIAQIKTPITAQDTEQSLVERLKTLEHRLYPQVVSWLVQGQLRLQHDNVYFNDKELSTPLIVT
ncbi:MAG: phosphoribosylglycinamide formyltransferase [Gammaproteobacteria bacterium]|nr:phosphoribosylglycinamide formyltransferase [Gammaproteobacteria bacterium]